MDKTYRQLGLDRSPNYTFDSVIDILLVYFIALPVKSKHGPALATLKVKTFTGTPKSLEPRSRFCILVFGIWEFRLQRHS